MNNITKQLSNAAIEVVLPIFGLPKTNSGLGLINLLLVGALGRMKSFSLLGVLMVICF